MNDYTNNHAWAYAVGMPAGEGPYTTSVLVWFSPVAVAWIIHDDAVGRPLIEQMYRGAALTGRMLEGHGGHGHSPSGRCLREAKAVAANSPGMDPAKRFKNRF